MFQRFKNLNLDSFLDPKLAEEQAQQNNSNQKQGRQGGAARSASAAQKAGNTARTASPSTRGGKSKSAEQPGKAADPDDFVIGDDVSDQSRAATPRPAKESDGGQTVGPGAEIAVASAAGGQSQDDNNNDNGLPEDVRKKLARLDQLTAKYQDLLRNYRAAHARVAQIEPFESTLRENTPLTSISEPGALAEFLNQRSLQGDMVLDELKRVSGEHKTMVKERDELKVKLEEAQKATKDAFDEAAGLKDKTGKPKDTEGNSEMFFSQDDELKEQQKEQAEEIRRQLEYINELETENAQYRQDAHAWDMTRLDLEAMRNKISIRDREIRNIQSELSAANQSLEEAAKSKQEHEENLKNGKYVQREEHRLKTYEEVVGKLRTQVRDAEETRKAATNKVNDLEFEIKRLEAEVSSSASIISRLRPLEERADMLTKRVTDAETARDEALRQVESKKGHEAAVASLRSQLKRSVEDRDAAYKMILNCGKCSLPEGEGAEEDEETSLAPSRGQSDSPDHVESISTQPTEASTPTAEDGDSLAAESKKKKKKKSKSKAKKVPSEVNAEEGNSEATKDETSDVSVKNVHSTLEPLTIDSLRRQRKELDDGSDAMRRHLEQMIETRDQQLLDKDLIIRDRDEHIQRLRNEVEEGRKTVDRLEREVKDHSSRHTELRNSIDRLESKLKEQESLEEEIETLKESLTDLGGDITDAKRQAAEAKEAQEKLKAQLAEAEKEASSVQKQLREVAAEKAELLSKQEKLEAMIKQSAADAKRTSTKEVDGLRAMNEAIGKEMQELKAQHSNTTDQSNTTVKSLTADVERLTAKSTSLETDLAAANLLAQNRYKELTEMKQHFSKVQPELKRLRDESKDLQQAKDDMNKANADVVRLEVRERELKAEVATQKAQVSKNETEIADLRDKVKKARERSAALEDTYERSRKDIEEHQRTRDEAVDVRDKLQQQLDKAVQDRRASKAQLEEAEKRIKKLTDEARTLRDDMQLKSAKHASAQSHMDSLQDQSREMATQMKEAQSRCDSLEEELADSQRLLSERSREAETMRRLLTDVEGRADSRVKEMRERLDLATEERDRAEDEASTLGRKKAREVEDYKNKLRDLERDVSRANDTKKDAERRERDIQQRHTETERQLAQAQSEVTEVRAAMTQLRDALDEGERQARELDKQRLEVRKTLEEREVRLEKLQKSSRAMADELRALQSTNKRQPSFNSARASIDDANRALSPAPRSPGVSNGTTASKGDSGVDYVYLKNILLQFLEQKEKKHQMQLIPVLGMLLHFDKTEEARWMSVVTAK